MAYSNLDIKMAEKFLSSARSGVHNLWPYGSMWRKRIFYGCEIVLQNARCGGRALIKMFCFVTAKK